MASPGYGLNNKQTSNYNSVSNRRANSAGLRDGPQSRATSACKKSSSSRVYKKPSDRLNPKTTDPVSFLLYILFWQ
jgi:hypothetical protein